MQGIHCNYTHKNRVLATNLPYFASCQPHQISKNPSPKHKSSFNGLRLTSDRTHHELHSCKKNPSVRKTAKKSSTRLHRTAALSTRASLLLDLCNDFLKAIPAIPSSLTNHLIIHLDGIPSDLVLTRLPGVNFGELYVGSLALIVLSTNSKTSMNRIESNEDRNDSDRNENEMPSLCINDGGDHDAEEEDIFSSKLGFPFMEHYDVDAIMEYYSKRPLLILSRFSFIIRECSLLFLSIFLDAVIFSSSGSTSKSIHSPSYNKDQVQNEKTQQVRASQLVNLLSRLGPIAIKIGQSLSTQLNVLPPAYMDALESLQNRVPAFSDEEARSIVCTELGQPIEQIFSHFSAEPIAASSLSQVYKAKLCVSGKTVAVKVQRPGLLSIISLDLFILRCLTMAINKLPNHKGSLDFLMLFDHWAAHLFQELDYTLEAKNAEKFGRNMRSLTNVVVPKPIMQYTTKKVLVTSWIEGEKLSKLKEDDSGRLMPVALNCYLSQLLESGYVHIDPHPGNLMQTVDGRLGVLDFGLMIQVPEDKRYALIECLSHLVHSDYEKIGDDLINLGFLPSGQVGNEMAAEILPHITRVLGRLEGGGEMQDMDFDQMFVDLIGLANEYGIMIPPYFTMIFRAFLMFEGMALKTNPDYMIIDECYPYICKKLLTDNSPRARAILKYFLYGKKGQLDAGRVEEVFRGFQEFQKVMVTAKDNTSSLNDPLSEQIISSVFAPEGSFIQELVLTELVRVVDALSREATLELWKSFVVDAPLPFPRMLVTIWPTPSWGLFGLASYTLSREDKEALTLVKRLWKLMGSEASTHTLTDVRMVTRSLKAILPQISTGVIAASTRFWLMLLHRKALRYADDLDGTNSLVHWDKDPAAYARHVRPHKLPFNMKHP